MTTSTNNWMLIKIIKLVSSGMVDQSQRTMHECNRFQERIQIKEFKKILFLKFRTLIPLEPKIAKKLIEPLTNLINR